MNRIDLFNECCLETLSDRIKNNSIDLVLTSPPYDDMRSYNGNVSSFKFKETADLLFAKVKPGGVVVWIIGDQTINGSETLTSFKQALYFNEIGFNVHDTMIYMKDNPPPVGGKNRYYQSFEYMFVFSKGKPNTFNPIMEERRNKYKDKRTSRFRPVTRNKAGVFTSKNIDVNNGMVKIQNIWSYVVSFGSVSSNKIAHEHPAIFPEALVRDHIVSWSNENDLVYDPFSGSGTTAKVCGDLKRNFIGSEINENYFNISKKRLELSDGEKG